MIKNYIDNKYKVIFLPIFSAQVIVCLIDFIYPPKPAQQQGKKKQDGASDSAQERNSDEDEIAENVGDDLVDEEESEAEESEAKEAKESEAKELEASEKDKDTKADPSSPNVRKRKPRKAD